MDLTPIPGSPATLDAIHDPAVRSLVGFLPIMSNGKPRRFRRYCECFEWTFNKFYNVHVRTFASPTDKVRNIDNLAGALWDHQRPRRPVGPYVGNDPPTGER